MSQTIELPSLNLDAERALPLITDLLLGLGFQVLPSFDLKAARASHSGCECPHHGSARCDCQMVVLLVYGHSDQPTSMIVHGQDGKTYLSLVDTPQQRPDWSMHNHIRNALVASAHGIE
jgi:hypothetical protein